MKTVRDWMYGATPGIGPVPDRATPPTVEELRKRRAPAAVKAAMGCVDALKDLNALSDFQMFASGLSGHDREAAARTIELAIASKREAIRHGLETLEDIGRELDE